mmetsp:Transcript_240/g.493  ORF Transcript_240/g.493 Transcript_240/m.493 type:complete len:233 (+) Transcript_240:410-1108(+)
MWEELSDDKAIHKACQVMRDISRPDRKYREERKEERLKHKHSKRRKLNNDQDETDDGSGNGNMNSNANVNVNESNTSIGIGNVETTNESNSGEESRGASGEVPYKTEEASVPEAPLLDASQLPPRPVSGPVDGIETTVEATEKETETTTTLLPGATAEQTTAPSVVAAIAEGKAAVEVVDKTLLESGTTEDESMANDEAVGANENTIAATSAEASQGLALNTTPASEEITEV